MPDRLRAALAVLLLPLCLLVPSANAAPSPLSPVETAQFDGALAQLGLDAGALTLPADALALWGGDKYKLALLDFLRADARRCGPWARSVTDGMLANRHTLGALVTSAHSRLDHGIRLGLVGDPLEQYRARIAELGDACLAHALAELTGDPVETYLADPAYIALPQAVREAAALVLFTAPEALADRRIGHVKPLQALGYTPERVARRITDFAINTFAEEDDKTGLEVVDDRADALLVERLLDSVDWNYMHRSSTLLAIATQEAHKLLQPPAADSEAAVCNSAATAAELAALFRVAVETPLGLVELCGGGNDAHTAAHVALSIDTGGDDTYVAAGSADFARPIGISIDLAGNDRYENLSDDARSFGAGIFGTGILIDVAGDDTYTCTYGGTGSGIFGTGVLYDMAGNDTYDCYANAQGSGTFGTGLLIDLAGDDEYRIYKYGQGYGGTRGCGILLDAGGDDRYLANLTDHFNGGLYGPTHHVHFVQGSAYGRRADITDGHSWAGGFGLLCDGAGDDFYEADVYAQGNSYWHACGVLVDKSGNDTYRAGQYSQASAPHFAIGILQDDGGDDRYLCSIRQSLAHGRDWSIAWLEDSAGDDWYQGARTTLGCSHVNSISVLWDKRGADTYILKGPGLGDSEPEVTGSPRDWLLTLGLFIDGGGRDGYYLLPGDESYEGSNTFSGELTAADLPGLSRLDFAGDGKSWRRTELNEAAPGYMGIGVDYE